MQRAIAMVQKGEHFRLAEDRFDVLTTTLYNRVKKGHCYKAIMGIHPILTSNQEQEIA